MPIQRAVCAKTASERLLLLDETSPVPLLRLQGLFAANPYGAPVLRTSRLGVLARRITDPTELNWMKGLVTEHVSLDAEQVANRTAAELKAIGSPFQSEPRTEAQLYEQVLARLEELRKNLEEDPFSERDFFSPGIPEKFLQRWLVAKFRETQKRRFGVYRC